MALKTSELWQKLRRTVGTRVEYKWRIADEEYGEEAEVSHSLSSSLFEELSFGNAVCTQLTLSLVADTIPRGAKIERYVRLMNDSTSETSEWIPAGVFWTNRRGLEDGVWAIEAFDAMRKTEQPWEPDQGLVFPLPVTTAVQIFASTIDVELDDRTKLIETYTVDYPASDQDSENGSFYTIRQELQWIAAAHGGNWVITPEGKLRLIPLEKSSAQDVMVMGTEAGEILDFGGFALRVTLNDSEEESGDIHTILNRDYTSIVDNGVQPPISRITLNVDDENVITAGDDTGVELIADCPLATQEMADTILLRLRGYQYQMASIEAVNIDPSVELGDWISAEGLLFLTAQIDDDGCGYPNISAPGQAELEDEYPVSGPITRAMDRKLAETRSAIEKSAEELRLYVQNDVTNALSEVDVSLGAIRERVTDGEEKQAEFTLSLDSINQRIANGEAKTAEIETKVDSIKLEVANEAGADGQVYARVTLTIGPNRYSGYIKMEGNVDVSGQLSADALYAAMGDIADLTVDRLSTSRRIVKYLAGDTSDDNYVRIYDQYIKFATGETDGRSEQATSPSGLPLYWEDNPKGTGVSIGANGYPYKDGARIFTTTAETRWPVMVYVYTERVKRSIGFEEMPDGEGTLYSPVDIFGAGASGEGEDRLQQGRLVKKGSGLELIYTSSGGKKVGLRAGDGGYMDLYGLRKTTDLDFSNWGSGTFTETVEGIEEPYSYKVEFDGQGRPVKITDDDGKSMDIKW